MFFRGVIGLTQRETWISDAVRRDGCQALAMVMPTKLGGRWPDWIAGIESLRRLVASAGYKYTATPIVAGFARFFCPR